MSSQFVRFLIAGGASTFVNLSLFTILVLAGVIPWLAVAVGYLVSVTVSFWLSKSLVFTRPDAGPNVALRFFGLYGFSLVLQLFAFWVLTEAGVSVWWANLIAIGVVTLWNFAMLRFFVFRTPARPSTR